MARHEEARAGVSPAQPWWSRRWKVVVALSVVGGLLALAGFVTILCSLTFGLMRQSGAYQQAVAAAKSDHTVIETLGTPIEEGYFVMGEIELGRDRGYANLTIPISGPRAKATIYVEADKAGEHWSFRSMEVVVDGTGQWIHLGDGAITRGGP
jgi:hypothetical protein